MGIFLLVNYFTLLTQAKTDPFSFCQSMTQPTLEFETSQFIKVLDFYWVFETSRFPNFYMKDLVNERRRRKSSSWLSEPEPGEPKKNGVLGIAMDPYPMVQNAQ